MAAGLLAGLGAQIASAAEYGTGPWLKGYTDILGGIIPAVPGLYARDDAHHYQGSAELNIFNGRIHIDVQQAHFMDVLALTYVTPIKILGGTYAVSILPTLMQMDVAVDISIPAFGAPIGPLDLNLTGSELAQGDTGFSPLFLGWEAGNFHWNLGVFGLAPTGRYNKDDLANTSLHHWALMTRLAGTYSNARTGFEVTGAAIYSVSWENPATEYETGNILNLEGAITQTFGAFGGGAVAYAMIQTTPDSGEGARLGAFQSQVYGIGPILTYTLGGDTPTPLTFIAKWYHEFGAVNTFEGDTVDVAGSFKF